MIQGTLQITLRSCARLSIGGDASHTSHLHRQNQTCTNIELAVAVDSSEITLIAQKNPHSDVLRRQERHPQRRPRRSSSWFRHRARRPQAVPRRGAGSPASRCPCVCIVPMTFARSLTCAFAETTDLWRKIRYIRMLSFKCR